VPISSFTVNWDYRCPYARNAHEHVVAGLTAGAGWDVTFIAFSLDEVHVAEGEPSVFDVPDKYPGLLVNSVGIAVRDRWPEQFLATHLALFAARHDQALDIRERSVVSDVLTASGLDPAAVLAEVDAGWPLETLRKEHEASVAEHQAFGVPTFVAGDQASFVRLTNRPAGDAELATSTIERVVDLLTGWPELNEFKHTTIRR
jgi:2-hydroxychromene-2-carboxylate isomerase